MRLKFPKYFGQKYPRVEETNTRESFHEEFNCKQFFENIKIYSEQKKNLVMKHRTYFLDFRRKSMKSVDFEK